MNNTQDILIEKVNLTEDDLYDFEIQHLKLNLKFRPKIILMILILPTIFIFKASVSFEIGIIISTIFICIISICLIFLLPRQIKRIVKNISKTINLHKNQKPI